MHMNKFIDANLWCEIIVSDGWGDHRIRMGDLGNKVYAHYSHTNFVTISTMSSCLQYYLSDFFFQ